jgi:GNAT superfamily N-acetyltransferase
MSLEPSELVVLPAQPDDREWIVACQLAMAWETERLQLDEPTVLRGVAAVLDDPSKGAYWIARRGDEPVGVLLITFEWSDWRDATMWWIQSVFVTPPERGRGVFTAMYDTLREQVRQDSSLCGLRLYVNHSNHAAKKTYQRLGMSSSHYEMMQWMR